MSGDGKSLQQKNASLPHDGRRTQAKADDVTLPYALGSRRIKENNKTCRVRARAWFLRIMDICLHLLSRTQRRSGYPCDGACSARASGLPMFSRYSFMKILLFYL